MYAQLLKLPFKIVANNIKKYIVLFFRENKILVNRMKCQLFIFSKKKKNK